MSRKLRGLIIRETNVGEADKILTVLTHEEGKVSIHASNVRRSKSRLTAGARFLCYSDFVINEGRNIYFLSQCTPLETFFDISADIVKLALATYLGQLTAEMVPEGAADDGCLSMLLNTFYVLAKSQKDIRLVKAAFELRLMSDQGYAPAAVGCQECGKTNYPMYFDLKNGSFTCFECQTTPYEISEGLFQAIQYILFCNPKKLYSFLVKEELQTQLSRLAEDYAVFHTGKTLQSLEYLKLFL